MKKRFCVLMAIVMVVCLLPISVTAASTVWDGTIATAYAGGTGT